MIDLIIVIALVVILGSAGGYIYKEKKKGRKCIGCPCSSSCSQKSCEKNK